MVAQALLSCCHGCMSCDVVCVMRLQSLELRLTSFGMVIGELLLQTPNLRISFQVTITNFLSITGRSVAVVVEQNNHTHMCAVLDDTIVLIVLSSSC